jgi:uncharacterized protein YidB (DUF937 family)
MKLFLLVLICFFCKKCGEFKTTHYNNETYLLQAPRDFVDAGIPKGYMIQVISSRSGTQPHVSEVVQALRNAGFGSRAESWASPGNWIVKEMK